MAESSENTFTAYLGPEFQQKLMWQLLVEPEFAEKNLPNLAVEYFDDPNLKRLFIIILEYYKEHEKVPNLQNQSIQQAINTYKTPNNLIEEESLYSVLKRVQLWNERVLNKETQYDGDVVRRSTTTFIKQQEWRKFAEFIIDKTKTGDIRKKHILGDIDERLIKISHIGDEEDAGTEVIDNIEKALRKEFRQPLPTGVDVIDGLTGGGLGKGEIGVVLTPSGVGKTTLLTKIANNAYELEKNVLQVIFEDTTEQIQRKHFAIWSKVALSKMDDEDENRKALKICSDKAESMKGKGVLLIKRFSQENTTMLDIKNWMIRHQKKYGIKFDLLVLDYLDCLESHKKTPDRNEAELQIIKSFEALASDFDIPAWTAIQTNRSGFDSEYVEAHQTGGSIKRIQKAHFFMSVAKTKEQKEAQLANIRIIKARFAQDGQTFNDCIFNNDTMEIRIEDDRYKFMQVNKHAKHHDEKDIENLENNANKASTNLEIHSHISQYEAEALKKVNDDGVSDGVKKITDYSPSELNDLLRTNAEPVIENNTDGLLIIDDAVTDAVSETVNDTVKINEIENIHICTTRTDLSQTEINAIVNFANEVVRESENNAPFEWNGESGSTTNEVVNQPEVKVEDIPIHFKQVPAEVPEVVITTVENKVQVPIPEEKPKEIVELIDPDAQNSHPSVHEMLRKKALHQGDITKK